MGRPMSAETAVTTKDAELIERVAMRLHAADRSGSWATCQDKEAWRKWARIAIKAVRE